jgi:hypothetical protein
MRTRVAIAIGGLGVLWSGSLWPFILIGVGAHVLGSSVMGCFLILPGMGGRMRGGVTPLAYDAGWGNAEGVEDGPTAGGRTCCAHVAVE